MKLPGIVIGLIVAFLPLTLPAQEKTSCIACHTDADLFDDEGLDIAERFSRDIHAEAGLSCHDCHGGNSSSSAGEDMDLAKDRSFLGAPRREAIPAFCGRCHSDPEYMRRFDPDLPVDQEQEYRSSHHGKALAAGNTAVATCTDCHGVHGILRVADPESPVYPTHLADTCRVCHGDAAKMEGVVTADGRPVPIDQYALWRRSVHAAALYEKGDLSAPTCNDCHGNHAASPPGLDSITFVCGQCHGREARLFRASSKHEGFIRHNEYMLDAGEEGCAACHEAPEPQVDLVGMRSFTECATCHGNHAVIRPTIAMLAGLPETPCSLCHESPNPLAGDVPEPGRVTRNYERARKELLARGSSLGLEGNDLFDWLVDEALVLPSHTLSGDHSDGDRLRPEFSRLFEKLRIGKTHFTYEDPAGKGSLRGEVVRCTNCHAQEPLFSDEPVGYEVARDSLEHMRELMVLTSRAQRVVLSARHGGVETREALSSIDAAVDAGIGLEVLIHTFTVDPDTEFAGRLEEGLAHARVALAVGQEALDELAYRRHGLGISLIFIALVAIGLAAKIRQLSRNRTSG